jgi:hypothetical protein
MTDMYAPWFAGAWSWIRERLKQAQPLTPPSFEELIAACSHAATVVRCFAIEEMARQWPDRVKSLATVQLCFLHDLDLAVQLTGLREMIRGWKNDPATRIQWEECARTNASGRSVRWLRAGLIILTPC